MDKTLEIIMAATVLLLSAGVVMFMVSDQTGGFGNFLDNQTGGAECDLALTQYKNSGCNDPQARNKLTSEECGYNIGEVQPSNMCSP